MYTYIAIAREMNAWNIVKRKRDVRAEMKKNWQLQYSTHELDRGSDLGLDVSELGSRLVGEGRTYIERIVQWRITSESLRPALGNWATAPQPDPMPGRTDVTAEVERRRPGWKDGSRGSRPVMTSVRSAMNRGSRHVGQQDNGRVQLE